jgi:hypothetical protein
MMNRKRQKGEISLRTAILVAIVLALMAMIVFSFDYFLLKSTSSTKDGRSVTLGDVLFNVNRESLNANESAVQDPPRDPSWTVYQSPDDQYSIAYPSPYAVRTNDGRLEIYQPTKQLDEPITVKVMKDQLLDDRMEALKGRASSQTVKETTLERSFAPLAVRLEVQEGGSGTVVYHLYVNRGWLYELREVGPLESIIPSFRLE